MFTRIVLKILEIMMVYIFVLILWFYVFYRHFPSKVPIPEKVLPIYLAFHICTCLCNVWWMIWKINLYACNQESVVTLLYCTYNNISIIIYQCLCGFNW